MNNAIRECAASTLRAEAEAVGALVDQLTDDFEKAVKAILATRGKVIVTGMGKSGLIGRKIAATLSSTGTPSFFLHPGEAYHGDLGMIEPGDVVLAISNSGQTDEVLRLIPFLENNGNTVIGMTGNAESTLAKHCRYHLSCAVAGEACPLSLAPTSSTTAQLAMGDALAVTLMHERGFRAEDFARFHPGGSLGRRLLTRVSDVMRRDRLPVVAPEDKLGDVMLTISDARLGMAVVVEEGRIAGIATDGDIRRAMIRNRHGFLDMPVSEIMTRKPVTISASARLTDAEEVMQANKVRFLVVPDDNGGLAGVVELYDVAPSRK